jgi:hypothetical protein
LLPALRFGVSDSLLTRFESMLFPFLYYLLLFFVKRKKMQTKR